ncbi:MAG: Lrp/AsnC family transcriptional regulator [Actinobacteria bacterium]|nr:MAG: Lrp/AsnC family transcriptional regulator [Actinomycetota bacterium]
MARAYVLIRAEAGKVGTAVDAIRKLPNVKAADAVTGPYDVIAVLEAEDFDTLGKSVVDGIQKIEGVYRTLTCLGVDL